MLGFRFHNYFPQFYMFKIYQSGLVKLKNLQIQCLARILIHYTTGMTLDGKGGASSVSRTSSMG